MNKICTEQLPVDDLRAAAIVLRYAASMYLEAARAAGDAGSLATGNSILELVAKLAPETEPAHV